MHAALLSSSGTAASAGLSQSSSGRSDLALYFASLPHLPSARLEDFRALATSQSLLDVKTLDRSRVDVFQALDKVGHRDAVMRRLSQFAPQLQDKSFTSMQEILPGLFIGSYHPASNKQVLRAKSVSHICCCIGVPPPFPSDFQYHVFPAKDVPEEDILRYFRGAIAFIDGALAQNGRVLVHCGAGISRASTIATAFLMHRLRIPFKEALHLVHSARPFVRPNPGFILQLKHFESLLSLQHLSSMQPTAPSSYQQPLLQTSTGLRTTTAGAVGPPSYQHYGSRSGSAAYRSISQRALRPVTAQLSVLMPELRARPAPASVRAQSAAVAARRRAAS